MKCTVNANRCFLTCDDVGMSERNYTMPPQERDKLIMQLRARGWTLSKIAKQVGMSTAGVGRALDRIADGGFGMGAQPR